MNKAVQIDGSRPPLMRRKSILFVLGAFAIVPILGLSQVKTSLDCSACHVPEGWKPLRADMDLDHNQTSFPLESVHRTVRCIACHKGRTVEELHRFSVAGDDCIDCHLDVHKSQLGQDCARCHTLDGWTEFDRRKLHDSKLFPLTGVHLAVECEQCHITEEGVVYTDLGTQCVDCHEETYEATAEPSHAAPGLHLQCEECHFTIGWRPAYANHEQFGMFLEGVHASMNCAECHTDYDFTGQRCLNCHSADYKPGHSGFLADEEECWQCHTTGGWKFYSHDDFYFPIYSGEHRGKWDNDCSKCHINPNDFQQFSCGLNGVCHEHRQSKMDSEHQEEGVSGYVYDSQACYGCHPRGEGDD